MIKIVECPRDAMQGWKTFIPTDKKAVYLNTLLQVGFDTLDCGSFVSPKAIPQMADSKEVLSQLNYSNTKTKILVIVANLRGAEEAVHFELVHYLGFPFSISETFQQRNTNSSIAESLLRVEAIQQLCFKHQKELVVYLSMCFGNPYGDAYSEEILLHWANEIVSRGIRIISLADTVGLATPQQITIALETLLPKYPHVEFGVHLHSSTLNWQSKFEAALQAGCLRFDGAIEGIGGCPMAGDALVGNMNTEWMLEHLQRHDYNLSIDKTALANAIELAKDTFV
ncbi:MAG: hydroxymethylglutaryl-CoA lyase [Chitinophagaceae bacterium]|nr:hydroxymethylglutaryl-CoA lyase [Chitinophagaceae bacterium]